MPVRVPMGERKMGAEEKATKLVVYCKLEVLNISLKQKSVDCVCVESESALAPC